MVDEMTGEWRKLYSEELHNLHSFPNIIRQIKSRRMRWVKENEVGEACGKYGRGVESVQGFRWKAGRKETTRKTEA
jgi:hypothetical protein